MGDVKKQAGKESGGNQLRAEAEKKVARSADKSREMKAHDLDKLVHELQVHQVELEMQNEELRSAQGQLEKSRNDYADLYDFSPVGYFTFDGDALITGVNLTGAALLGVERQKLLKRRFRQFVAPADAELWDRHFVSVLQQGEKQNCDLLLRRKDGSTLYARLDSIRVEMDDATRVVRTGMSDITEHKKAEDALSEKTRFTDNLIDSIGDPVFVKDDSFRFILVNNAFCKMLGIEREKIIGETLGESLPEDQMDHFLEVDEMVLKSGQENLCEEPLTGHDGNILTIVTRKTRYVDEHGSRFVVGLIRDITERKQSEAALQESEVRFRELFNRMSSGVAVYEAVDNGGDFILRDFNPAAEKIEKVSRKDILGRRVTEAFTGVKTFGIFEVLQRVWQSGKPEYFPENIYKDDKDAGSWRENWVFKLPSDEIVAVYNDVTERKQSDEVLRESEARYRLLSEHMTDFIWLMDMNLKPTYQSPSAEKLTGFTHEEIMNLPLERRVTPQSLKLTAEVFLEKLPRIMSDTDYNPILALELEIFRKDGTTLWSENMFSIIRDEHGKPVSILGEARDITRRRDAEEKLVKSYESLKKTLNDAINTMVKIVETRDPYTAGHQQKVADLATAIAGEMKLEDARIDQLRMAAVIHDIGKMYIPSDILSRPGKLTDMEFSLIKTHAQAGFDIVKGMDLPCNVAKTVLQHHERLDGSGYPNRLKGEDTLLEAKILSVADVVEAMAAHRPYRQALGIDKALEEISNNRGILYDPDVVDACLELFNNGRFEFKSV